MVPVKDRPTFLALLRVAFFRVSFVVLVCVVVGVRKAQSCIRLSYLGAARALIYSHGGWRPRKEILLNCNYLGVDPA